MAVAIGEYVPSNYSGMGPLRDFPRVNTIILNITLVFLNGVPPHSRCKLLSQGNLFWPINVVMPDTKPV